MVKIPAAFVYLVVSFAIFDSLLLGHARAFLKAGKRMLLLAGLLPALCCTAVQAAGSTPSAPPSPASASALTPAQPVSAVAQARELVDTYYGDASILAGAALLLQDAYRAAPNDPDLYVQAGRITVKGGHLVLDKFVPGTWAQYEAFIDKALALDPNHVKAHILKAGIYSHRDQYPQELEELDKAYDQAQKMQASTPIDPWLWIGYGRVFRSMQKPGDAYAHLMRIEPPGPGASPAYRAAYVWALSETWSMLEPGEDRREKLRKHARLALAARYPTDAWSPQSFAANFITMGLFDDAITYAREALKTMDFGVGRRTLAVALYAKAAQLKIGEAPARQIDPLVNEARSLHFSRAQVISYLEARDTDGSLQALVPVLQVMVPQGPQTGT